MHFENNFEVSFPSSYVVQCFFSIYKVPLKQLIMKLDRKQLIFTSVKETKTDHCLLCMKSTLTKCFKHTIILDFI